MPAETIEDRVSQIEEALEGDKKPLATSSSVDSVRTSTGPGLAMLPYLTIDDIILLRQKGFNELEDLEERLLEVPEPTWAHVLDLIRSRVVQVDRTALRAQARGLEDED